MAAQSPSKREQKKRGFRSSLLAAFSGLAIFTPIFVTPITGLANLRTNSGVETPNPSLDFNYLGQLSKWLGERAALKNQAVRIDGEIDRFVFKESASAGSGSPRVIEGRAGVAFIADAFNEACNPHIPTSELITRMRQLSQIIEQSGRDFALIVSPDKSTILNEFLPIEFDLQKCFELYNESLWSNLAASGIPGYIDLRDELLAARVLRRELLFKRRDSHWDNAGGSVAAKTVVESFAAGIWKDNLISFSGLIEETGDLDVLSGQSQLDVVPTYSLARPGVVQTGSESIGQTDQSPDRRIRFESQNSPLITGRTLILGDSFSEAAAPFYLSYFEDITLMRLNDFSADKYVEQIRLADRVIFWSVERSFPYRVAYDWGTNTFTDALREKLK